MRTTYGPVCVLALSALLAPGARAAMPDESPLPAGVRLEVVSQAAPKAKILTSLQDGLDQIGLPAKVDQCDLVVAYFDDQGSGRDSSYGADCTVRSVKGPLSLVMCDDWMIGRFTLTPGVMTEGRLGRFIRDNCPPGA